ncbi:UNVERIFIED_CONTAM: hypothetical protein K2H54_029777 [Gekko kuhli]
MNHNISSAKSSACDRQAEGAGKDGGRKEEGGCEGKRMRLQQSWLQTNQTGNSVLPTQAFITVKRRFHSSEAVESLSQIFILGEKKLLFSMKTGAWLDVQQVY